jgi:hypothetical protein
MSIEKTAYLVGGGIGSLAAAAFLIRDGGFPGQNISIFEAAPFMGGSLDGAGEPASGYSLRGGRMFTADNYECTWDLFKSIPSQHNEGQSVYEETVEFNGKYKAHSLARLVDRRRAKVPVTSMGFSKQDRVELLELASADEDSLGASCITDWLSPRFFETEFWYMWSTTFAFQPWHSAVEFKRYLHRFILEFSRIDTLGGVKRTIYNQYDSLVLPLLKWLTAQGVRLHTGCRVTDLDHRSDDGKFTVTGIHQLGDGENSFVAVKEGDLVFVQNASMTDASSLGSMTSAPIKRAKADSGGWTLWEKLAAGRPEFGNPGAFNNCIAQSCWESFTVTLKNPAFFDAMHRFSGNEAGTGGLADVHCPGAPAALHKSACRGAGILGLRAVAGQNRQFCRETHGRMQRRGNLARTLWPFALRFGGGRIRQLHSMPDALHHQHVHASRHPRPTTSSSKWLKESRLHQPIRRDPRGCGVHGRILGASGSNGRLPIAGNQTRNSPCYSTRQITPHGVRGADKGVQVTRITSQTKAHQHARNSNFIVPCPRFQATKSGWSRAPKGCLPKTISPLP